MLQTLDSGIIHCVKSKYRISLVQKTTAALGRKQLKQNVLQALHLVATACSSVSSDITEHFFSKDGFGVVNFARTWTMRQWRKKVSNKAVTFTGFVNCDNNIVTTAMLSVEDICGAASKGKEGREKFEEELDDPFGDTVSGFETTQL
jgi:hypothetical protein